MKRIFMVALVVIIAGGLFLSCTEEGPGVTKTYGPTDTGAPPVTTTTTAPTATGVPDTGQTYDLKMALHVPTRASIHASYYAPWAEEIEKATNGRVKITMYPDETLVKEADMYDAVVSGLADLAACGPDATPGRFPLAEFVGLPLMWPNATVGANVVWDIFQEFCLDEYKDVLIMGTATITPAQYFGNKEVKVPGDFAHMRVRSGGTVEAWIVEALGAVPIDISTGDLSTAMERQLADACFLTWSFSKVTGVKNITEYRTALSLYYRTMVIVMNKDKFNSMPKVLQDAIMSVSGKAASVKYSVAEEASTAEEWKEVGGTLYTPTAEEKESWSANLLPVWDRWVATTGGEAQNLINRVKELITKYSK